MDLAQAHESHYQNFGSPDILKCQEIEKPLQGDDEVLIKVRAASVNPLDWKLMKGGPFIVRLLLGLGKPKIKRLGVDVVIRGIAWRLMRLERSRNRSSVLWWLRLPTTVEGQSRDQTSITTKTQIGCSLLPMRVRISSQDSEGESRHGEEVHGRDDLAVIAQESSPEFPCLLGRRQAPDVARNCTFRDLEAEFEKFTVNPGSAPGGILLHHPPDERSNLGIDLWPAKALWPRAKAPEQPKASAMPGDNGFWFDNNQDVAPCRPKAAEQNPKYSILDSQPRVRLFSLEYTQLLTEGKDLKGEVVARTEESAEAGEEADKKWNHEFGFIA